MKIIICTFTFPPNKDGVAEAAWSMACGFADRGHEVVVCTGHLDARSEDCPHPGVKVASFRVVSGWRFAGASLEEKKRMQAFIVDEAPDFVFCHCWEIWSTAFAEEVFPLLPRTRKILVSHGYTTHQWRPHPKPPLFGLGILALCILRVARLPLTMRSYDRVVFLSHARNFGRFFDHLVAKWTGYTGIRVIPNGTDPEPARGDIDAFRSAHDLDTGVSFLCVANYGTRKNQELAVRAVHKAAIPGSTLVLIGSEFNEYSDRLRDLDQRLSREGSGCKVVFLEKVDRKTTLAAFKACDVFLLTATAETQPIAILEAMAAGMPFISTDTGCVAELPGGLVVDGETRIAQAMRMLASDPVTRASLGDDGRNAVVTTFAKERVLAAQAGILHEFHSTR